MNVNTIELHRNKVINRYSITILSIKATIMKIESAIQMLLQLH